MSSKADRALVIEGTVMFGFGAAKCVEFALQNLDIDVCAIIPEQFSVNIFYDHYVKKALSPKDVYDIYASLKANNLHRKFTIIKTGYLGNSEYLNKVGTIIKDIKGADPEVMYVCDPVVGDNDAFYSTLKADEMTSLYKSLLLPMASITTPNQFEVESFSSMKIHNEDDALKAIQRVHDIGPNIVVMTSCKTDTDKKLMSIGSRWNDGIREAYRLDFEYIDAYLVGTGDLFAGCFIGYMRKSDDFKTAFEQSISTLQHICQSTYTHAVEKAGHHKKPTPEQLELRIVQSAAFIREPVVTLSASRLI